MRSHLHINSQMKQDLEKIAQERFRAYEQDNTTRCTYLWCLACLQAGLSPRTIRRIMQYLPAVSEKYADYKSEALGDLYARLTLASAGLELPETTHQQ